MHIKRFTPRKVFVRDYSKFNVDNFKNDLRNAPWANIFMQNNMNSAWNEFKSELTAIINRHAPLKEKIVRGKPSPWLTTSLRNKMHERDYLLKVARRTGSEKDWSSYKRARNNVTYSIRESKAQYFRNVFQEKIDRPKDFWKQIKKVFPSKTKSTSITSINVNGKSTSDKKSISKSLINTCWKVYNPSTNAESLNPDGKIFNFCNVSSSDVLKVLKKIKTKKAAGPDNLPGTLIKDGAEELAAPLDFLIDKSLRLGEFPNAEKLVVVMPLYKSNDKSLIDNYRPISVLNVLSKLIECIVHQQLSEYVEKNNLFCSFQFGFRRGRSTQQAITQLTDFIRFNMDKSCFTGALYMDLRKAFDTVHHGCLLNKLSFYGIQKTELESFTDYLFNRSQYVKIENTLSDQHHVTHGVPQGSILGPLLSVTLINDLHLQLTECNILLYADDAVLYFSHKEANVIQNVLNREAEIISKWFEDNCLVLNLKKGKTEFILYGTYQKLAKNPTCEIVINGTPVFSATSYEYLGVILDSSLSLQLQLTKIYKKASARLRLLHRIRSNVSPAVAESIYFSMILPILL